MQDRSGVQWRAEERPCPACGADAHRRLGFRGGDSHRSGLGLRSRIVRCRACHLVYPRPFLLPDGNPYEAYTGDVYFQEHDLAFKVSRGRDLADRAAQYVKGPGRVLELGCGRGALLVGARDRGWTVRGVDMTTSWATTFPDLDIEVARLEAARSLEETYDFVILAAILEHLYEPQQCLARVHRALAPGGVLFIDVPNECGLWTRLGNAYMRLRGRRWAVNLSPTFAPFHVVGFCPASLRSLLRRSGFDLLTLEQYSVRSALPRRPGLMAALEDAGTNAVLGLGVRMGMGTGIVAWARKGRSD